ncbi:MAG: hypothetical protein HY238_14675 [Acidobacteria bacterium]|nr:hypothetical protein [Acidobacteriota bacterium]
MSVESAQLLRLLQLSDSALPIGAVAHSFGVETLAADGLLGVESLRGFLEDYLAEAGRMEAAFCRAAHRLAGGFALEMWIHLNRRLSARKPARESRAASLTLGRRFLELVWGLSERSVLAAALEGGAGHHSTAFGLAGGVLGFDEQATVLAWLQQSLTGLISASQRLMPLGQSQAARMQCDLKPALVRAAAATGEETPAFTPLVELASMRHPALGTRLFIS